MRTLRVVKQVIVAALGAFLSDKYSTAIKNLTFLSVAVAMASLIAFLVTARRTSQATTEAAIESRLTMIQIKNLVMNGNQIITKASTVLDKADTLTDEATKTTRDQRRILTADSLAFGRLINATNASLNCDTIGQMGKGTARIDCKQIGLLVQMSTLVGNEDQRLKDFSGALQTVVEELGKSQKKLNLILSDESIPRITKALAEASEHFDGTTIHLEGMSKEGERGMHELAELVYDLRHPNPKHPARFIQALSIILGFLKAGGQVAPLFK